LCVMILPEWTRIGSGAMKFLLRRMLATPRRRRQYGLHRASLRPPRL